MKLHRFALPAYLATLPLAAIAPAGLIEGKIVNSAATTSLTAEGAADWTYYQGTSVTPTSQKSAPTASIGAVTLIGSPTLFDFGGSLGKTYTWTDGTVAQGGTRDGVVQAFPGGIGEGFRITLPADTHVSRFRFFIGGANATGQITATLSDGSATADVESSVPLGGGSVGVYDVSFRANSAGQTLTIDWIKTVDSGANDNILIAAASLSTPWLNNAGFELPGGGTSVGPFPQATGWAGTANTALHASFPQPNNSGLGATFGFTGPTLPDASQNTGEFFTAGLTYTFKGFSVDNDANDNDIRFKIGYLTGSVFTELAGATYSVDNLDWTELAGVSWTVLAGATEIGKEIVVRIGAVSVAGNTTGVWYDNVSLSSTGTPLVIPAPGALPAGLAMIGLAAIRRRRFA